MSRLDIKQIHHKSFQRTIKSNFAITVKKRERCLWDIKTAKYINNIVNQTGTIQFEARLVLSHTPNDLHEIVN